jgi:hypothetical protein
MPRFVVAMSVVKLSILLRLELTTGTKSFIFLPRITLDTLFQSSRTVLICLQLANYQFSSWYSAAIQEKEFINFSYKNTYYPLINETIYEEYLHDCEANCVPETEKCTSLTGQQDVCWAAQTACSNVDSKYASVYPVYNPYDIRQKGDGTVVPYFPPSTEIAYLQDPKIAKAIGAKAVYQECPNAPGVGFYNTADGMPSLLSMLLPA